MAERNAHTGVMKQANRLACASRCRALVLGGLWMAAVVGAGGASAQGKPTGAATPVANAFSWTGATGPVKAPVTVVVFGDFACPYSADTFFTIERLRQRYAGSLRVLVKQSPLPIHPDAPEAHRAALAAGLQGKFTAMAELLYANQQHQDAAALHAYARQLGLDVERFDRDMHSERVESTLENDLEEAQALGIEQTPTLFLNGKPLQGTQTEATLAALVDRAMTPVASLTRTSAASAGRAGVGEALFSEMMTAPAAQKGAAGAPLTIVEFTDFQCPFCRTAVEPMEQFMALHGSDVRWVYRAFPLDFHQNAQLAAEAALAAGAQGRFWEMHDLMFAHQNALKEADLLEYATELHLDVAAFGNALRTRQFSGQVAADRALAERAGVEGTPTFLVDGRMMSGARSLPELEQMLALHKAEPGRRVAYAVTPGEVVQRVVLGPKADTPLRLTWFTDVRSSLAGRQAQLLRGLEARYGNQLQVMFKAVPVDAHPDARLGSQALLAAYELGKFWDMYEALAGRRDVLTRGAVLQIAAGLRLEPNQFAAKLDEAAENLAMDAEEARQRGIAGAPVMFVGKQRVDGLQSESAYTALLDGQKPGTVKASLEKF